MDTTTSGEPDPNDIDRIDITDGPVGFASLKEPTDVDASTEDLDPVPSLDVDETAGSPDPQV